MMGLREISIGSTQLMCAQLEVYIVSIRVVSNCDIFEPGTRMGESERGLWTVYQKKETVQK